MKPLRVRQTVHNHQHLIAPQLALDILQHTFQARPKLISCEAVPEATSRLSLVTARMDFIHEFT